MNISHAPVVLDVDGTPGSAGAIRYACREAKLRGALLHVVHVIPLPVPPVPLRAVVPMDLRPHGRAVLQHALEDVEREIPGLDVTSELVQGTRVRGIVEAATGAQLLVLGRETRHGFDRLVTGATTAGVAAHAACPTVAVPDSWMSRENTSPHVVVGLRQAEGARHLLATAFEWAESHGGTVSVLHAWSLPDAFLDRIEARTHADEWEDAGQRLIDQVLAEYRRTEPGAQAGGRVVHGQPAAALATAARNADLVVVRRSHEHRPWDHLGTTVRALLLMSDTPVMVVPSVPAAGPPVEEDLDLEREGAVIG
jgi:nucleotide-binding universal stress UspA family protein